MTGRKIPKFPKRLNFPKPNTPNHQPTTFEELHQSALEDEESGDRFKLSDLLKSLRFYNSSYEKYLKAQSLKPTDIDNLYNLHCLVFNVWELYKNGNFSIVELGEDLQTFQVLRFGIVDIKKMYDMNVFKLLNEYSDKDKFVKVSDFCFNLIVVNMEVLESGDNEEESAQMDIVNDCLRLFELILNFQSVEVESFINDVKTGINSNSDINCDDEGSAKEGEKIEYETVDQVTPDTVLDTLAQAYKLMAIFLGNSKDIKELKEERARFIAEFKTKIDTIASGLFDACSNGVYQLNEDVLNEIKIQEHLISSLMSSYDYDSILASWDSFTLSGNYSWKLAFVDNLTTFMELNQQDPGMDRVAILNKSNELFRDVENTLKSKLKPDPTTTKTTATAQTNASLSQSLDISDHLIKLVECLLNRSDNELTKFQITNNQVNITNCSNILKTALNYLNSINCGLRETMVNKLIKRQLKRQIWVRLIILEEKFINLDKIKAKIGERFCAEDLRILESNTDVYISMFSN
ncbi:hypothetical protein WICPIJ_007354 [Wickerhamomyces pijperi]|uniref:Uncharacterized protein n=1 Tax=Wickerhamomyces pijperi TaxID=599730 RepID=A0A9P8Q1T7_WICPI|nr:hypothetical protein WICPIJ_007354 [Wickerhamomyces pijperi]